MDGTVERFEDTDKTSYLIKTDDSGVGLFSQSQSGEAVFLKWWPSVNLKDIQKYEVNDKQSTEPPRVERQSEQGAKKNDAWLDTVVGVCSDAKQKSSYARDASGEAFNDSKWLQEIFNKTDARADWIIDLARRSALVASQIKVSGEEEHRNSIMRDANELYAVITDTLNLLLTLERPASIVELKETSNTLETTVKELEKTL
jgi:hypothetical protein